VVSDTPPTVVVTFEVIAGPKKFTLNWFVIAGAVKFAINLSIEKFGLELILFASALAASLLSPSCNASTSIFG